MLFIYNYQKKKRKACQLWAKKFSAYAGKENILGQGYKSMSFLRKGNLVGEGLP